MIELGGGRFKKILMDNREITQVYLGEDMLYQAQPTVLSFVVEPGSIFTPEIELYVGSTAELIWTVYSGGVDIVVATGISPTIDFSDYPDTAEVILTTMDPEDVRVVNLGFNNLDDNGRESLSASYNKDPEPILSVDGLQYLTNLYAFMAANTELSGGLNLSGCSTLAYVECFQANLDNVELSGCTSLIRLCVEGNNLTFLNLNPVADNLRDLRAALQQSGSLELYITQPMTELWHWCVRGQALTGYPTYDMLPACEQYWAWYAGLSGPLRIHTPEVELDSVLLAGSATGVNNTITSLNLSGNTWSAAATRLYGYSLPTLTSVTMAGSSGACDDIRFQNCGLTSFEFGGVTSSSIELQNNAFGTATMDAILAKVNGWGTSGGLLNLANNGSPTIEEGQPHITALQGRGWTVTTPTPINDPLLWEDDFHRANGPLTAPWEVAVGGGSGAVSSNQLVYTGGSGFQRLFALPSAVSVANHEVKIEFDGTPSTLNNVGVLFHMNAGSTGCKANLTTNGTVCNLDNTMSASGTAATVISAPPSSWSVNGTHTVAVRVSGSTAQVYLDGVHCFSRTSAQFSASSSHGVGFCGALPGRTFNKITVTAI